MSNSADPKTQVLELIQNLKDYFNTRSDLLGLQMRKIAANTISSLATSFTLILILFLGLIFGSFALAFYLNDVLSSNYLGFSIIAGFYCSIAIIILIFKRQLKIFIINSLIQQMFQTEEDEED